MPHAHEHHGAHAEAAAPTLSLLRLSAAQRLVGVSVLLAALWALVLWVIR
jgi:hypothetical protein